MHRFSLLIALGMCLLLAGCQDAPSGDAGEKAPEMRDAAVSNGQEAVLGLLIDSSGLGDRGYLDNIYQGILSATEEHGLPLELLQLPSETITMQTRLEHMDRLVGRGCTFIVCSSASMRAAMDEAARRHPDVFFVLMDTVAKSYPPNVCSVTFASEQGAFLAGALAAAVSESGVLGVIGGKPIPAVLDFVMGFEAGALHQSDTVRVVTEYIHDQAPGSIVWNNPEVAATIAEHLHEEEGADIFFPVAGASGMGVFNYIEQEGLYAIGVDSDQDYLIQGRILTSVLKRMDVAVQHIVAEYLAGTLQNRNYRFDLASGAVGLTQMQFTRHLIPDAVLQELDKLEASIAAGELVPPSSSLQETEKP